MPTVIFDVKDEKGRNLGAVVVTADGDQLVAPWLDGRAIAIDPGDHVFHFASEGFTAIQRRLVLREGEKDRREQIVLTQPPPVAPAAATVPPPTPPESAAPPQSAGPSQQRAIGLIIGGVGAASLVVGSVVGLVAKSTYDDALKFCPSGPQSCSSQGVAGSATAHNQAAIATVAFVGGLAALAAGTTLYLTAPPDGGVSIGPTAYVRGGGVGLRGAW
jgi:hypothetical protein